MIGHDHVADQQEIVPLMNLAESVHEKISPPLGIEQRQPPIATEREEVQIPASIVAFQSLRHDKKTTRKPDAWGTLVSLSQGVLQQWYPLFDGHRQEERRERNLGHPSPREQGGVPMRRKLSDQEFHALYCPVKNAKSALFLVAYFSLQAFGNWKGLHEAPEHLDLVSLSFIIIVVAMLAKSLVNFTCFRERLVLGLIIVSFVTGEVYGFFPGIVGPYAYLVKFGDLALSLLGLLVSLTMLVQSARSPDVGPSNAEAAIAWPPKKYLLILLVAILTVLVLSTLLYFLPFRQ